MPLSLHANLAKAGNRLESHYVCWRVREDPIARLSEVLPAGPDSENFRLIQGNFRIQEGFKFHSTWQWRGTKARKLRQGRWGAKTPNPGPRKRKVHICKFQFQTETVSAIIQVDPGISRTGLQWDVAVQITIKLVMVLGITLETSCTFQVLQYQNFNLATSEVRGFKMYLFLAPMLGSWQQNNFFE